MDIRLDVNEPARMIWLRILLRVLAVGFLAAFIPWITLILVKAPILAPGGSLAPLLRFQPYNAHYRRNEPVPPFRNRLDISETGSRGRAAVAG